MRSLVSFLSFIIVIAIIVAVLGWLLVTDLMFEFD